jgi:hypothetical protein
MKRKPVKAGVRFAVFTRDSFTCQYCGRKPPEIQLVIDHVIPVAQGGTDDEWNLKASCDGCNAGKSDKCVSGRVSDIPDPPLVDVDRKNKIEAYAKSVLERNNLREAQLNDMLDAWCVEFDLHVDERGCFRYNICIENCLKFALKQLPVELVETAIKVVAWKKKFASDSTQAMYMCGVVKRMAKEMESALEKQNTEAILKNTSEETIIDRV